MRIIHTSDWHLGQHFYGKSRQNEHKRFLSWLAQQVVEQSIDAIVVSGDVFDTGTPPSYVREMNFDFVLKMHQLNCQLVVLAGNHDSVSVLEEAKQVLSSLACYVIAKAQPQHMASQIIHLNNGQGEASLILCAVPFIRPRDILTSKEGEGAQQKQGKLQQAIVDYYKQLSELAQQHNEQQLPIMLTGHLTVVGAQLTESVRDIYIGTLEALPVAALPSADYIALGHIHRPQKVGKQDHIRYSGSPIAMSFDEAQQQKEIVIVDFSNGVTITPTAIPCFQPLVMLKTTIDQLAEQLAKEVEQHTLEEGQHIWLDIELQHQQLLADLTQKIEVMTQHLPVEVLLIRRDKNALKQLSTDYAKPTLSELDFNEVFADRLAQEDWQQDSDLELRLNQLFKQTVEDVQHKQEEDQHENS